MHVVRVQERMSVSTVSNSWPENLLWLGTLRVQFVVVKFEAVGSLRT